MIFRPLLSSALAGPLLVLSLLSAPAGADSPVSTPHVEAELVAETTHFLRGGDSTVALKLTPEPGWHTYWINPGDSGLRTRLQWTMPDGVSAGEIQWPAPHTETLGELTNYGYGTETLHLVSISVPADWPLDKPVALTAQAKWLVCKDVCIPGEARLSLTRPVAEGSADLDPAQAEDFERSRAELPQPLPGGGGARFAIADGSLSLAIDGLELGGAEIIEFFPLAGDLVNHSAPQKLAIEGRTLRLSQGLSSYFLEAPAQVEGVLAVSTGPQRRAWAVRADAGAVAPVTGGEPKPATVSAAGDDALGLAPALLLALLGGLILNLMPCVFPVLSLKALSLAQSAERAHGEQRRQALAYSAGTVLSCLAIAGLLLALRAGGEALGWGFQLQSPVFIGALAYLMLALGLAMSGLLEIGTSWMGAGSSLASRPGLAGSFFTGVLAVVVASPCTAPFMGSALGYAVTQPLPVALAIFAALGLGLALPFLLLGFVPALARRLPRPGVWMLTFKQAMAFPLYLTVAWLLWVLTRQAGADALGLVAVGLVAVALSVWLLGREGRGLVSRFIALISLAAAGYLLSLSPLRAGAAPASPASAAAAAAHEAWSPERVAALRAEGRTVFVDFTADWCITCKVNERGALASDTVREAFERDRVAVLVADWTRADPTITRGLAEFGRNGVPLYLVYPNGGEPRVLPQVLTPQIVVDALKP